MGTNLFANFGMERKAQYVGKGKGSIITTKSNRGRYSKTRTKPTMKIPERSTHKMVGSMVHGDIEESTYPPLELGGKRYPRFKEKTFYPFVMRTQGGRDIPKDVWNREKYWGTYTEARKMDDKGWRGGMKGK